MTRAVGRAPAGAVRGQAPTVGPVRAAFFHAGGLEAEIEEVFRRILASGAALDTVEIACASDRYAALIWEKAIEYRWPVTLATGIPATLTRPGRALLGWTEWIEDDFAAGRLRRLLQSGDIRLDAALGITPGYAARLLVRAQAAWGRETYGRALARLAASERRRANGEDIADDDRARRLARADQGDVLGTWLASIVDAVPTRGADGRVDLGAFVACAGRLVADVAAKTSALDHASATRLGEAIGELAMLGELRCTTGQALRFVRERVETLTVGVDRPRPGHLHVSRLRDAALAGRPHLFIVGLEEGRVFPAAFEDPVLLDEERARIRPGLPLSTAIVNDAVQAVKRTLDVVLFDPAIEVCFSYSCRDLREFRETYASWVMLLAYRIASGDPAKSYGDLRKYLGTPVSCVPATPQQSLGSGRWWLEGVKRAGEAAGRAAVLKEFPALTAGVTAEDARKSAAFTEFDGRVPEAGLALDPCGPAVVVSPTQLEEAAACPFRYFLRRGLQVQAIESGERDRDLWLNPLIRGSMLHDLYARFLRRCRDASRKPSIDLDRAWLQDEGQRALDDFERDMPPPSLEIKERESRDLLTDLQLFLESEVSVAASRTAVALEVGFGGRGGGDAEPLSMSQPVVVSVAGLTFRVAGRIDRIDELADGTFEILDYKTGRYYAPAWKGTFAGGRRLQHALYGLAALELLKARTAKPKLGGAQYYFSSTKGRLERKIIPLQSAATVGAVLSDLRDVITSGSFIHAPEKEDCKFCDYGGACGAKAHKRAKDKLQDPALAAYRRLADHG